MPLIGLPNRFILTLIKRGFILICLLSILYLFSTLIMGHLSDNNRVFTGVGSGEINAFVGSNVNTTDVSSTIAKKSMTRRNQKIPKLILDQSNVKSQHNINSTKHNDNLRRPKESRQWRQRDENQNPVKNENDQQFLALINENDDDSAYEIENATKIINGRIVHVRQRPISHPNNEHLSKLN
uniref:Uncharacterized protein n=1 Tax=Romanomermis culicivorax TaxID=13658 RepID=A0A915HYY2_ROMCU